MNKIDLPNYNLEMTLLGGQAFNFDFDKDKNCYWGFTQDKAIQLKTINNNIFWQTYPENNDSEFVKKYLRLDVDYSLILKKIQKDKYIKSAIKKYPNIRLLKQDFEQTLLSFLISPNNNIKAIRKIIRAMCKKFGKKITIQDKEIYLFPKTEVIADAKLGRDGVTPSLLECKLGFRAKFLKGAANYILEKDLSKNIKKMTEDKAREELLGIKGVGDKIADCVLVFGLGFDNVTPLDVWAKRAFFKFYKLNPKIKYEEMRNWAGSYFGGYAAWAGQYLYEYIRNSVK